MTADRESGLTRKQRREQARSERKALEAAKRASAAQRKRLIQLGGVVGAVVVIIVVILLATGSGGSKRIVVGSAAATKTAGEVYSLIGGIPQSGNVLGYPNAPVTMEEFADLECPYCKGFTLGALSLLITKYVRTGKLRLEYRAFETATQEPAVFTEQQTAALAAGRQGLMWYFVELFYHEQGEEDSGYVTPSYLEGLARQVPGLNVTKWQSERNDKALENQVVADREAHEENHLDNTPSFLVGKTGGPMRIVGVTSLTDPSGFETAINAALTG
jgi:protein-disulfide isomerase